MKNALFFVFGFLLFANQLLGVQKLNFKYLTTKNGLSNNYVTTVLEDSKGFLWFGTSDGLNKWNGYEMEVFKYKIDDEHSISSNFILSLTEDHSGNIWIGTNQSGVIRYDYSKERFIRYASNINQENSVPSIFIRKIVVDVASEVWIATDWGLCKYVPETDNFKRIKLGTDGKTELIYNIYPLKNNDLVFQTNIGLFRYNPENKIISKMEFPGIENIPYIGLEYNPLGFTSENNLWIGSSVAGLFNYNLTTHSFKKYNYSKESNSISSNEFSCIFEDSQHRIWIGTKDGGLNLYNSKTDDFQVIVSGALNGKNLSNNIISTIYEDKYQNVWIGTQEGGLTYFNGKNNLFQYFEYQPFENNSLLHNKVSSFVQDKEGTIWVGTGNGGVNKYHNESGTFERFQLKTQTVSPSILGMINIGDELYVTGWGGGLHSFNIHNRQFKVVKGKNGSIPNEAPLNIKGIGADKDGNIWLASHSQDGIFVYNPILNQFFNARNPGTFNVDLLKVPYALTMKQDWRGRIWIASYSGLFMYDGEYHRFKTNANDQTTISSNYLYALYIAPDSTIWLGNTNGFDKLIEKDGIINFERYSRKYQLPNNIKSILQDNKGNFWLSSNLGLTMFDPKTKISHQFQMNKELPMLEFYERSCLKSKNGELYFGSTSGFFKFHPDSITSKRQVPRIYITEFRIFNEPQIVGGNKSPLKKTILETDTIKLSYNQSAFSFEFVALDINSSGLTEYAYLLEGLEDKWNYIGDKRFVNFTNLSPGEYTFRVRTTSGKILNNGAEAKIHLIIAPPFWKTKLAYIAYLIAIVFSLYLFQRSILYQEKLKNELRLEKIEVKNVIETNLMKLRFFTNISHEFRTPITLIKAPIEKLMNPGIEMTEEEKQYHYQLISNSTNKLLNIVNQLMDYRKLEAGSLILEPSVGDVVEFCRKVWENFATLASQKEIDYQFNTPLDALNIAFDADKLDKVISNLLSNAFKCTDNGGKIDFSVSISNVEQPEDNSYFVTISVKDNGIGIPEKDIAHIFDRFYMVSKIKERTIPGSGIGLTLAKEMIELHKGTIEVTSKENEGSEFVVKLPITIESLKAKENSNDIASETQEEETTDDRESFEMQNSKPKLLVIEDDDELLRFLAHELSSLYRVIIAKNGQEGFQKAIENSPNLVLSDVMMPVMDGMELCKKIKTDDSTSHLPVILLTARYSQEKELEGFQSGADAYIVKPFNLQILKAQIANLLSSRKELVEKFKYGTSLSFESVGIESKDQKLMQVIIDWIIENISNDKINADFIADKLHISRSLLYIKIEALTGQTVNEFIRNIRLKKAIELMGKNNLSFTEIAYTVGFTSQSYFSRSFTKQFGCSPKEYLKQK